MYIVTALVDGATNSQGPPLIAFQCEDSANIFAAAALDQYSAGQILSGKQFGAGTTNGSALTGMTDAIGAACNVVAIVTQDTFSAGKINLFIDYVTTH